MWVFFIELTSGHVKITTHGNNIENLDIVDIVNIPDFVNIIHSVDNVDIAVDGNRVDNGYHLMIS